MNDDDDDRQLTAVLYLRLTRDERDAIAQAAKLDDRSATAWARRALAAAAQAAIAAKLARACY